MRTKRFCELIERALKDEYGEEVNFDTVPYVPEKSEDGRPKECLGVFLLENVHMAKVAAKAMYMLWQDHTQDPEHQNPDVDNELNDIDEAMNDFVELMGGMRIAPYMQWHCAYFPGLTAEQVLAESEAGDEPVIYGGIGVAPEDHARMTSEQLFAEFDNMDVQVRWYSGRGMMGAQCVGISGTQINCDIAWSTVREAANSKTQLALDDKHQDNLGYDVIVYFPQFTKES